MSISFSGLTSGLDTSSWIESLTALKKAKIETLEEEKEAVVLSQKTLNDIKSFFNSFRTTVEKITDAKFGIPTMDLFTQKLVNSSNTDILTAIATNEAEENTYNINVNKLATETQAVSNFSYRTTTITTTIATLDSSLSSLGVKSGEIGVTVDGNVNNITINDNDTIGDFINNLKKINVNASYNEKTGIFSVNLNASDIDDSISNTGIIDALHLKDANKGYQTNNSLEITKEETIVSNATEETKLKDLDVKNGTVTIKSQYGTFDYNINDDTTIGDFIAELNKQGIEASLDSNGILTISDMEIIEEGSTNIKDALGLNDSGSTSINKQITKKLEFSSIIESDTVATQDTLLKDIGTGLNIQDGDTIIVKNLNNETNTITLNSTSTIGDLITELRSNGIDANLSTEGILSIENGNIIGGTFDIINEFNLNKNIDGKYTSSNTLNTSTTTTISATGNTKLKEFGITNSLSEAERTVNLYDSSNDLRGSITVTEETTINDLLEFIKSHGLSADITNGKINIFEGYISNITLENAMGLEKKDATSTAISTKHTYTIKENATASSKLYDIFYSLGTLDSVKDGYTLNYDGHNISVNANTKIEDIINTINAYGGNAQLNSSTNKLEIGNGQLSGSVADALGITSTLVPETSIGQTIYTTQTETINGTTTLGEIVDFSQLLSNSIKIMKKSMIVGGEDTIVNTISFNKDTTIDDFLLELKNQGLQTNIKDGIITIESFDGKYINGKIAEALNISISKYEVIGVKTRTSSEIVSATNSFGEIDRVISENTKINDILNYQDGSGEIYIKQSDGTYTITHTITIDSTKTLKDFFSDISEYGLIGTIELGRVKIINPKNNTSLESKVGGSNLITALKLGAESTLYIQNLVSTSSKPTFDIKNTSNENDTLKDLIFEDGSKINFTENNITLNIKTTSSTGNTNVNTVVFSQNSKISDLVNTLNSHGLNAVFKDGILSIKNNIYNSFELSDSLGNLLKSIAATTNNKNISTSKSLEVEQELIIKEETKLSDLGITDGIIVMGKNLQSHLLDISDLETIGDFMDFLKTKGFQVSIDTQGKLSIIGEEGQTLYSYGSIGSNIIEVLGLNTWTNNAGKQSSDSLTESGMNTTTINLDTKLADLQDSLGNPLNITSGNIYVSQNGIKNIVNIDANETIHDLAEKLKKYNINLSIKNGTIQLESTGDTYLMTSNEIPTPSNILSLLGLESWEEKNSYTSSSIKSISTNTVTTEATRDTLLSDLGVTNGEFYIYKDGVKYTEFISLDETVGSFLNKLESHGFTTGLIDGKINVIGQGNSYIEKSDKTYFASNIVEKLFETKDTYYNYENKLETKEKLSVTKKITEDDLIKDAVNNTFGENTGILTITIDDQESTIEITENETFGSFIDKFNKLGLSASLIDGKILIQGKGKDFTIEETSSHVISNLGMIFSDKLGNFAQSSQEVLSETKTEEVITTSVSNWADGNTKLDLLNITSGELSIYLNGEKFNIQINSNETFDTLKSRLASASSNLTLDFENGHLKIYSTKDGDTVQVGSTTDTTNFMAITGLHTDENGVAKSSRELYKVNETSRIMEEGLFRSGNVAAGTFEIGNAQFTINENTTFADLISQINSNEDANATAYWDSIEGKFVIKSRSTGAALINIASIKTEDSVDSSNQKKKSFTDIMGYTSTEVNSKGQTINKLNINSQEIGENAKFSINGTYYTSTSNKVTSDISRIKGLTINLKGISEEGSTTTITVEKDKESLANAVSEVVNSYNELIENVDEAIAQDGNLKDQSTLKLIRNQIRNLMISSDPGTSVFKNLDSIGICIEKASANNISVSNISKLTFDKDAFYKAFDADSNAVKELLIGGENNNGILTNIENTIENALKAQIGYFDTENKNYDRKINKIDNEISKANKALERYKESLEKKFASMDYTIGKLQQQYSSFLGT